MNEIKIDLHTQVIEISVAETVAIGSGGGGTSDPVSSAEAGLAPATAGVAGNALFVATGGAAIWRPITQDDIQPAFAPSLLGGGILELGESVTNPSFTAAYVNGPPTAAALTDSEAHASIPLSAPFTSVVSPYVFSKQVNNASVTFTLSATKGVVRTASAVYLWRPRAYWGVGTNGLNTEGAIEALANSALASSRSRSFTLAPGVGQHIYYAYPDSYGAGTFVVGGFEGGFELVGNIPVTNAFGITQNYRLYKSTNPNLGSTNVVVS